MKANRCGCSLQPTSSGDYCDEHRPFSKDMASLTDDELEKYCKINDDRVCTSEVVPELWRRYRQLQNEFIELYTRFNQ